MSDLDAGKVSGTVELTDAGASDVLDKVAGKVDNLEDKFDNLGGTGSGAVDGIGDALGRASPKIDIFDGSFVGVGGTVQKADDAFNIFNATVMESVGSLGALLTAGAVFGAAMVGWKIGRAAAEFFDLDKKIGDLTAKLLGIGDVAGQEAAAGLDVLAKASKTMGFEIKDMDLAMAINAETAKGWKTGTQLSAEATARWQVELDKIKKDLPGLDAELKAGNLTQKELAANYKVSEEAIKLFSHQVRDATKAEKEHAEVVHEANERKLRDLKTEMDANKAALEIREKAQFEEVKLFNELNELRVTQGGTANEIAIAQIDKWAANLTARAIEGNYATEKFYNNLTALSKEKMGAIGVDWQVFKTKSIPALQELRDNALKTYNEMLYSGKFFREDLDAQKKKYEELRDAARGFGDAGVDANKRITDAARVRREKEEEAARVEAAKKANREMGGSMQFDESTTEGIRAMKPWLARGFSKEQASRLAALQNADDNMAKWGVGSSKAEEYAQALKAVDPSIGRRPQTSRTTARTQSPMVSPGTIARGGGGGGVTVNLNVSGVWDPRSAQELTKVVKKGIEDSLIAQGGRLW